LCILSIEQVAFFLAEEASDGVARGDKEIGLEISCLDFRLTDSADFEDSDADSILKERVEGSEILAGGPFRKT